VVHDGCTAGDGTTVDSGTLGALDLRLLGLDDC
jgi:hypothetical protein